jgi:hypothetical protein
MDLLIKQATEGLSAAEERELEAMDDAMVAGIALDLERAAAAVSLAAGLHEEPLPPAVRARLVQLSDRYVAETATMLTARAYAEAPKSTVTSLPPRRSSAPLAWFAAAACLVVAIYGWVRHPETSPGPETAGVQAPPPATTPLPPAEPSAAEQEAKVAAAAAAALPPSVAAQREAMLAKDDVIKIKFGPTKDPAAAGVTGDAVWDPATQTGFVHFAGLKPNDPAKQQYQMWIFDATRDKRFPVDGGVFDIPADATEATIPLHAAIAIRKVAAIAVTVEKAGGTVVSGREHVVVLGAAG